MIQDKYIFMAMDKATTPPSGIIQHLKNRYWIVHPQKGLAFYRSYNSPQCNENAKICARLKPDGMDVLFVPSAFIPVKLSDYRD